MRGSRSRSGVIVTGLVALVAGLFGCATGGGPIRTASPEAAMVFGHVDLPEAVRDSVQWIYIVEVDTVYVPPFKTPIKARFFPNGDFFAEGVAPGRYVVQQVVADMEAFYLAPPGMSEAKQVLLERVVDVKAGDVAYLGRHRITDWKRGVSSHLSPKIGPVRLMSAPPGSGPSPLPNFMNRSGILTAGSGTFSMEVTRDAADERRVLRHVLGEVAGSGWDARIEARLVANR